MKHHTIQMSMNNIAEKLIKELTKIGIECYIWHKATTGSVYIRFADSRMGSVRIGNHDGRSKLKYKYNLRSDISPTHPKWVKDENIWRFYLPLDRWKDLIPVLALKKEQVKDWPEAKYRYTIPKFKQ